ncbi:hypothetical protein KA021_01645 [Candidatus Saccharibacteria bacterium]|nr:hypothetical protein [Candidatus Saccharibacteria bacterium]
MKKIKKIVLHPALLFTAGNTVLALEHAELYASTLNVFVLLVIVLVRLTESSKRYKTRGMPFIILALVNLITAGSVIHKNSTGTDTVTAASYFTVISFIAWGLASIFAGLQERQKKSARAVLKNPQFYNGIGDMSAVNASGVINPISFPFMIIGFAKSFLIGRKIKTKHRLFKNIDKNLTSARLYGLGFFIGAATSLDLPYFVVAQLFWGLAYFQFKKEA